MNLPPDPVVVERFRDGIARQLGLQFDDAKTAFLGEVLMRRIEANRTDAETYLRDLDRAPGRSELGSLAEALTVCETYFFRNLSQFRAFAEAVIPDRMRANESTRRLRILSAACASGEEAYTIAMVVRETIADPSWTVNILAVDANPAALRKAKAGIYSPWALRETPADAQKRWFRPTGRGAELDETIRRSVSFEERNLAVDDFELWQPDTYDVVFCRNALMYFTPQKMRSAIGRITRALAPGGYLFLGHAETLRGLSGDYHLCHTHDSFYYSRRRKDEREEAPDLSRFPVAAARPPLSPAAMEDGWVGEIARATERVAALALPPAAPAVEAAASPRPSWDRGVALELLMRERFVEALKLIEEAPAESATDPDVLLLRAVLLAHSGQTRLAAETATRLLAIDEMNAGASYVLALCFENAGDRVAAANYYQIAKHLDPEFAMVRLHLGILCRRSGDLAAARRELDEALVLLHREDPSRLLLFGSGFTREALIALCTSELERCTIRR